MVMSGLRSTVLDLRRLRRSTARSSWLARSAGSTSSTSSISDFSMKPWSSSTSPSSSSTSARAVATSAYVSTPVVWPLVRRSFTSSSSCSSPTDMGLSQEPRTHTPGHSNKRSKHIQGRRGVNRNCAAPTLPTLPAARAYHSPPWPKRKGTCSAGLPRSRPGVRSGKRASARAPRRVRSPTGPQPQRQAPRAAKPGDRSPAEPPRSDSNPAEEALRLAPGAAGAVLGTASSVTRGILRRLPKP